MDGRKFISGIVPPAERSEPAWWFAFQESKLLVFQEPSSLRIPCLLELKELGLKPVRQNYLGQLDNRHCYAVELTEGAVPPVGMVLEGLRQVYGRLDEDLFWMAARAVQIVDRLVCGKTRQISKR